MCSRLHPDAAPVDLVVVHLEAIDASAASLSAAERERAQRFCSASERCWYLAAHAMLRELLAERCGMAPASLDFVAGEHGKPALAGSPWQFSLSHREGLAVYAFALGRAVGVDLEPIRPFALADAVAQSAFPRRELKA